MFHAMTSGYNSPRNICWLRSEAATNMTCQGAVPGCTFHPNTEDDTTTSRWGVCLCICVVMSLGSNVGQNTNMPRPRRSDPVGNRRTACSIAPRRLFLLVSVLSPV